MKRTLVLLSILGVTGLGSGLASAATGSDDTGKSSPICIGMWDDEHPYGRDGFCINIPPLGQ